MKRLWFAIAAWPYLTATGFIALAVAFLLMSQCERRRSAEDIARHRERAERLARDSAEAVATVRRTDSVFFRDTVRLTSTVTRWRTVTDSLLRTDTLTVRESVLVAAGDTVIRACQQAVQSCTQRVAARDSLIAVLGLQRRNDAALHRAQLARANPRFLPYVEAGVNPFDSRVVEARGGLEMRFLGPIRLTTAAEYRSHTETPFALLAGVRVTF